MVSKRINARASSRDVETVKNLIERCLQLYMTQKETMDALQAQHRLEPAITELVWQKLEEENREFFQAYYMRLMLMQQIQQFNKLLEQQARLMGHIPSTGVSSNSNSDEPQMPLVPLVPPVPKNTSRHALHNTGSALKQEDMNHPMTPSVPNAVTNGGSSRGGTQRRGDDVVHPLKVYLEDLYFGAWKKLSLPRNVICSKCNGKGSKSGTSLQCPGCQGKVSIRQLDPSMIQQMKHPCNDCKGTGEIINDEDRCPQCKGEKVVQEKKVLEVIVEKGMQNGQKITFPGEGDEAPDTITGDMVIVLQQQDHPKFKSKGEDLFVEHTLSLTEALCGFHFVFTHLDGRQLRIKSNPGQFAKPGSFKAVNNEGMPLYRKPFMKGKMYIHFTVEFPDSLNPDQVKALEAILPPKPTSQLTDMELDECVETTLHDVKHGRGDEEEAAGSTGQEADEEMHGAQQ